MRWAESWTAGALWGGVQMTSQSWTFRNWATLVPSPLLAPLPPWCIIVLRLPLRNTRFSSVAWYCLCRISNPFRPVVRLPPPDFQLGILCAGNLCLVRLDILSEWRHHRAWNKRATNTRNNRRPGFQVRTVPATTAFRHGTRIPEINQ